jgi:hypothetical protein
MTKRREDWQSYKGNRKIAETIHTMNNSREAFRLIVQRWPKLQGELLDPDPHSYHVIASNREELTGDIVHLHNQRGVIAYHPFLVMKLPA